MPGKENNQQVNPKTLKRERRERHLCQANKRHGGPVTTSLRAYLIGNVFGFLFFVLAARYPWLTDILSGPGPRAACSLPHHGLLRL